MKSPQATSPRPVLLADFSVSRFGLTAPVQDLSDGTGIPFTVTRPGRSGFIDETHPGYLGTYTASPAPDSTAKRVEGADALIRVCLHRDEINHGAAGPASPRPASSTCRRAKRLSAEPPSPVSPRATR